MSLAVGTTLTVTITDIAFGGEGVARFEDFVIFVPFVALDELAEVQIVELKKRFARARLLRVVQPSPDRTEPPCRYFGDCGGCQYQHLEYSAQLKIKHKQISDLFARVGHFANTQVDPVVACPTPYGYRNRIMIRSQWDKFKQGLNIGFIRADNRLVVDVEECQIAEPALNEQILHVRKHPPPKGGLKVVLRIAPADWEVPRDSFFQNNFFLLPELVRAAERCLKESQVGYLFDIYCGVGFFSISLAKSVRAFVGVELDKMAIRAANQNAVKHGTTNGEFLEGRAEELLPQMIERFPAGKSAVILDPPRTGCPKPMLELLKQNRAAQIVYISCHPATLARDLNILCQSGVYELKRVTPLDMFPQTQHVECVADLRLIGPPPG